MIYAASGLAALLLVFGAAQAAPAAASANLALKARASASESHQTLTPEKAADGNALTRWSGIPGHNTGVWFEMDWDAAVSISEVIVRQYGNFVMEMDLQVWEAGKNDWRTLRHFGKPGERLPGVVVASFPAEKTTRLRLGNITNGPSFTEVEAYAAPQPHGLALHAASDLDGHILGMVTDRWGSEPVAGARVDLRGRGKRGEWRTSVQSDGNGIFLAEMAFGLEGPVEIAIASVPGGKARPAPLKLDASDFQYGLTPRDSAAESVSLDGAWRFEADPPEGFWKPGFDDGRWADIPVPSHWEMRGFRSLDGVGGYRKRFAPPAGGGRLKLRFEGVYSGAEVWVNGRRVAYHEGGATPFEADITDIARPGENLLALRVREHTPTSDELDKMSLYADFPLGGIIRSVYLFRVPEAHIGALALSTRFDAGYRDAVLAGRIAVWNESARALRDASLHFRLAELDGRPTPHESDPVPVSAGAWERAKAEFAVKVPRPRKWEAEHPNLYGLTVELRDADGRVIQSHRQRIGFRQTEIRGSEILINGRPVKLRGTCHHDTHPLMGRAVTAELTRQDLNLMKEANLNAVRTSHYPPIPELPEIADEIGLYVEDEAPFCWVGVSDDLAFTPRIIQLTAELLARDRNHPSVFMWSLANESGFGTGFKRSHEWVRAADPDRPTSAATSADLEIATLHNPIAISRIEENQKRDRPLLFDESLCIFQGIFGDVAEMWVDPGVRDYYAEPLPAIYDRFMKSRATQGSFIWCWADDIFCVPNRGLEYGRGTTQSHFLTESYALPGRGLVGDAPWGVVDGWRRPKPEYWITKKLHSPVKIAETPIAMPEAGEPIRVPIENQYDFADLSELRIAWEIGGEKGEVAASVPARSKGELTIKPALAPQSGQNIGLTFTDISGRLVDAYRLPLGEDVAPLPAFGGPAAAPLVVRMEERLAGIATHVSGPDFELAFDQGSGFLRRGVAFGLPVLLEFPSFNVLPTAAPLRPLPDRRNWTLKSMASTREGDNVRISIKGAYPGFDGGYELLIAPTGDITVHSDFAYAGDDLWCREIGLRFSVPRSSDLLEWSRLGEWNVYPDDHIGRPLGSARAFADHGSDVPPVWPWAKDNSPMGGNDFRSTKRHIRWAVIRDPDGPGVLVLSDGKQSARATMETDRVSLHVNDWYGGTNAGWWEWEHNYGKGKLLKKGDHVASNVRLRLVRPE